MARNSGTPNWSVDFPTGWIAEQKGQSMAVRSPRGADVRFTTFSPADANTTAVTWAATSARVDRLKGRAVSAAHCGDFHGYETRFVSRGQLFLGWVLAANEIPLDVEYRCSEADAKGEEAELRTMLATLRVATV